MIETRMALLRPSELSGLPRDAIVLDLGDLASQGRQLSAAAQARADRIIADAKAERDRILAGAYEAGYGKGLEEGRAAGRKEGCKAGEATALSECRDRLSKLDAAWSASLASFESGRDNLLQSARADFLSLALRVAERVVKRRIECDPSVVIDQVASAMTQVSRPTGIQVSLHPDDIPLVQAAMPEMGKTLAAARHATLTPDGALQRGCCIVRSEGGGEVDASISTQLARITDAILPTCPKVEAAS